MGKSSLQVFLILKDKWYPKLLKISKYSSGDEMLPKNCLKCFNLLYIFTKLDIISNKGDRE